MKRTAGPLDVLVPGTRLDSFGRLSYDAQRYRLPARSWPPGSHQRRSRFAREESFEPMASLKKLSRYVKLLRPRVVGEAGSQCAQQFGRGKKAGKPRRATHLAETFQWLRAAQDAGDDGGVAARYCLANGWLPSYPETTGYIIPTFLEYANIFGDDDARDRALRMADWEIDVQLPCGAVQSGDMAHSPEPAVFNTGQVVLGWVKAYEATEEGRFREAATRACDWLVEMMDPDGAWRRGRSSNVQTPVHAYNARSAWALAQAGVVFGRDDWLGAAGRGCEWALTRQTESGWFDDNSFKESTRSRPLLHTICYVVEGLWGTGTLLRDDRFKRAARRTVDSLLDSMEKYSGVRGRYDRQWRPRAHWRCLTGDAQLAGMLLRMRHGAEDEDKYWRAADRLADDLCRFQNTRSGNPGVRGGIAGSFPIWGRYGIFAYVNWAAKFFLDALLLLEHGRDPHALAIGPDSIRLPGRENVARARSA